MVVAVRQHVRVGEGGLIEIRSTELSPGSDAEVIVLIDPIVPGGLSQFIGAAKGLYASVTEIDQFIRDERDKWES